MEVLNKREKKLYKIIKKYISQNNDTFIINEDKMNQYQTLLNKLKQSKLFYIAYADNCAFVYKDSDFKQFEIHEKEQRKELRRISKHDYKVAIISSILGAIIGALITFLITA